MRMLPVMVVVVVGACGGAAKKPEPVKPIANVAPAPAAEPDATDAEGGTMYAASLSADPTYGGAIYGGTTYGVEAGAFASLTGTGDISSGFDDTNLYGGLLGNEAGEQSGGGGTGWGTIGTGTIGTIGKPAGSTSAVPKVSIGKPSMSSVDLDKAIIRRYIKRNIAKITYCYEKQLLDQPGLKGKVTAEFTIGPDGLVSASTATGVDPDVADCIAAVIGGIEFPKPKGGGSINVKYPFTFRPTGG